MSFILDTSNFEEKLLKKIEKVIDKKIADNNAFNIEVYLTEKELANELKISSKKLSLMRKKQELPKYTYFNIGKSIRYNKSKVLQYFETRDKLV